MSVPLSSPSQKDEQEPRQGHLARTVLPPIKAVDESDGRSGRDRAEHVLGEAELVATVLNGPVDDTSSIWAAMDTLGLRVDQAYFVVVALTTPGSDRLASDARRALAGHRAPSAWRVRPGVSVGLVSVTGERTEAQLRQQLSATAARVGVSPTSSDWSEAARMLRLASVAARAATRSSIAHFHDAPVEMVVAAASDVGEEVARGILGGLASAGVEQRVVLLHTVQAWFEAGGSFAAAAERLFMHPNTIRNRVQRFETLTGRSLSRPDDIAAVAVALAVIRSTHARP